MSVMDYRLTDAHADPPGTAEHFYTEKLVRITDGAWCFRPLDEAPAVSGGPMLQSNHITFGCFNALPKITEAVLAIWSRILIEVPRSRLLLKNLSFADPSVRLRMRDRLEPAGIPIERVELAAPAPTLAEHHASHGRIDIALDTFPYHGTTSTCEAIWMGVPVITLCGHRHAARVGASLLSSLNLAELIANRKAEYVKIAVDLALDVTRLAELRSTLRDRMAASPLMNPVRLARNIENVYREMWRVWCVDQRPRSAT
jgi:predicted O-linked N-acetylglucosamine transferase (SPINDLY family)